MFVMFFCFQINRKSKLKMVTTTSKTEGEDIHLELNIAIVVGPVKAYTKVSGACQRKDCARYTGVPWVIMDNAKRIQVWRKHPLT